ncbi:MAG: hypothetical protein L3J03_01055 [Desulfobacterales bacterium]|nr:hypothetical protein [Desulfobacterales bacterium]
MLTQTEADLLIVLTDPKGEPVELPGQILRELRDSGRLTLYPAKYRLVYDHNNKEIHHPDGRVKTGGAVVPWTGRRGIIGQDIGVLGILPCESPKHLGEKIIISM